jgi:hypothetical protein
MQLEVNARLVKLMGHGFEGRDTDAAGDEDVAFAVGRELEIIPRDANLNEVRDVKRFVQTPGAAAAGFILQHGDDIVVALGGRIAQRILTHQAPVEIPVEIHVDMAACREGWQFATPGIAQLIGIYADRLQADLADYQCQG